MTKTKKRTVGKVKVSVKARDPFRGDWKLGDKVVVRKRGGPKGFVSGIGNLFTTVSVSGTTGKWRKIRYRHAELRLDKEPTPDRDLAQVKEAPYCKSLAAGRTVMVYEVPNKEMVAANKYTELDAIDSAQTRISRGEKARVVYNRTQGMWQVLIPRKAGAT